VFCFLLEKDAREYIYTVYVIVVPDRSLGRKEGR
jgi:hypothetical protein